MQEIEGILLYDRVFSDLNLSNITIRLNHRNILLGIAKLIGAEDKFIDFTITLDKLSKIGQQAVINELIDKGFEKDKVIKIKPLLFSKGADFKSKLTEIKNALKDIRISNSGIEQLKFIYEKINDKLLTSISIDFDVTLARGLDYYTGLILEAMPPKTSKMGSIGGGGRYDNLTDSFGLKNISGFGISFGFDRIFLLLEELNLFPTNLQNQSSFLFLNFGSDLEELYLNMIMKLRKNNISCEIYPKPSKLKKQMNYAHNRSIPFIIIIGSEEIEKDIFILKDMNTGIQQEYSIDSMVDKLKNFN